MTSQIVIETPLTATNRRQPLLNGSLTPSPKKRSNVGEAAGKATANCFLVCCCCPCVLVDFLILAVYKLPASLCRRIWRKRSSKVKMKMKKRKKRGFLEEKGSSVSEVYCKNGCRFDLLRDSDQSMVEIIKVSFDDDRSTVDLDMKMWDQFHSAGFWRSSSQKDS